MWYGGSDPGRRDQQAAGSSRPGLGIAEVTAYLLPPVDPATLCNGLAGWGYCWNLSGHPAFLWKSWATVLGEKVEIGAFDSAPADH